MKHFAVPSFWENYFKLPNEIQQMADKNFELLKTTPNHPSLHLKQVGKYWSVRVSKKYRAIGIDSEGNIIWFWIGSHSDYDKIIK
jgi:hypothetical protein